jgi:hypothetical protein
MSNKTLVSRISGMEEAIHNSLQDFLPSFELKMYLKNPRIYYIVILIHQMCMFCYV